MSNWAENTPSSSLLSTKAEDQTNRQAQPTGLTGLQDRYLSLPQPATSNSDPRWSSTNTASAAQGFPAHSNFTTAQGEASTLAAKPISEGLIEPGLNPERGRVQILELGSLEDLNDIVAAYHHLRLELSIMNDDINEEQFDHLSKCEELALDTETTGLNPFEKRLRLIQIYDTDRRVILVRMSTMRSPRICSLLENPAIVKIFHHARFDLSFLSRWLGVHAHNIFCTKIASKLLRGMFPSYSLKDLIKHIFGVTITKGEATSDWGKEELSREQLLYAAKDVLYLPALKQAMTHRLSNLNLRPLAQKCFRFVPLQADLDALGYKGIFEH